MNTQFLRVILCFILISGLKTNEKKTVIHRNRLFQKGEQPVKQSHVVLNINDH